MELEKLFCQDPLTDFAIWVELLIVRLGIQLVIWDPSPVTFPVSMRPKLAVELTDPVSPPDTNVRPDSSPARYSGYVYSDCERSPCQEPDMFALSWTELETWSAVSAYVRLDPSPRKYVALTRPNDPVADIEISPDAVMAGVPISEVFVFTVRI